MLRSYTSYFMGVVLLGGMLVSMVESVVDPVHDNDGSVCYTTQQQCESNCDVDCLVANVCASAKRDKWHRCPANDSYINWLTPVLFCIGAVLSTALTAVAAVMIWKCVKRDGDFHGHGHHSHDHPDTRTTRQHEEHKPLTTV